MNHKSRLMLPLAIGLVSIQVCSAMDQKTAGTQPPAQTEVSIPVAVPPKAAAPAPAPTVSVPAVSAPVVSSQVKAGKPPVLVDHYTVMPDDTLTYIAAQREVYGDARLWPLLYRANLNQIGPNGLIFPNQVLIVDRNHSPEELKALIDSPQNPWGPAPVAAKAPAPTAAAPAAPLVPITPIAPATPVGASAPAATAPAQPTAKTPTPAAAAAEKPADAAAAKPVGAPASAAPKSVPATSRTIKPSDYLNGAREAFAAGDSVWAIYYYSVYLEQKVTDIDVWGELGNVYYLEGEYAEAAKAYFNVANLLIDRGQTARALELIPVIEEGDAGLSAAIYQRLTTVKR
jgi:hypothetical protein